MTDIVSSEAWQCHQRIVELHFFIERSFLELGERLLWMKTTGAFKQFEHPTFESYLADPDVDMGRSLAYLSMSNYQVFVQRMEVDEPLLLEAGTSKLGLITPHVTKENVDELVGMAAALSRSDLRLELNEMFGPDATPPLATSDDVRVECPRCGQRFDIRGYIVKGENDD